MSCIRQRVETVVDGTASITPKNHFHGSSGITNNSRLMVKKTAEKIIPPIGEEEKKHDNA